MSTHLGLTKKCIINNIDYYITITFNDDNSPRSLFVTISKEGSTLGGLVDCIARLCSELFKYTDWETIGHHLKNQRFEPYDDKYNSIADAIYHEVNDLIKEYNKRNPQ